MSQLAPRKRSKGDNGEPAAAAAASAAPAALHADAYRPSHAQHRPDSSASGKLQRSDSAVHSKAAAAALSDVPNASVAGARPPASSSQQSAAPQTATVQRRASAQTPVLAHPLSCSFCLDPSSSSTAPLGRLTESGPHLSSHYAMHSQAEARDTRRERISSRYGLSRVQEAEEEAIEPLQGFESFGGFRERGLRERIGRRRTHRSCLQRPGKLHVVPEPSQLIPARGLA